MKRTWALGQPPEQVIARCVERLQTVPDDSRRAALLAVTEILAGLAFPDRRFPTLFGGPTTVIESPVLDEAFAFVEARGTRAAVRAVLESRFDQVPESLSSGLDGVASLDRLKKLARVAGVCPTLEAFEQELHRQY